LILFKKPVGDGLMVELYILTNSRDALRIEIGACDMIILFALFMNTLLRIIL
jgi:hypothetical protein